MGERVRGKRARTQLDGGAAGRSEKQSKLETGPPPSINFATGDPVTVYPLVWVSDCDRLAHILPDVNSSDFLVI
jgi:hypothetical protein